MAHSKRSGWGVVLAVASGLTLAGAVAFTVRTLPGSELGDIDPLSAAIALTALAVSLWTGYLALRSLRWQETNLAESAARLTVAVRDSERAARWQLLGRHDRTIDLGFRFRAAPAHDAEFAAGSGRLARVVDYYRALRPGRLVITGAPGAGKTVLAVELILGLLEDRGPDDPVPVRLSASAWDTSHPVEDWLARHLTQTYKLAPATARELVEARMVLPVVDGLDEMDAVEDPGYDSRAAEALRALNAYQDDRGKADLILTCRSGQYENLEAVRIWAEDAARIEIDAVGAAAAREFISRRATEPGRWDSVFQAIEGDPGGPLALGLSTPWRLTVAVAIYERRDPRTGAFPDDPDDLVRLSSAEAVRDHLLDRFIPAATAAHGQRYSAEEVRAWLTVLARYLDANAKTGRMLGGRQLSGTDIVLHELWPLAGDRKARGMIFALLITLWLVATPVLLWYFGVGFSGRQIYGAGSAVILLGYVAFLVWAAIWPEPIRADFNQLRTPSGRRKIIFSLLMNIPIGIAVGFVTGILEGWTTGLVIGSTAAPMMSPVTVFATVLIPAGAVGANDPRHVVRDNVAAALALGLSTGLMVTVTVILLGGLAGPGIGAAMLSLAAGLTLGLLFGLAGFRYVGLLMSTRKNSGHWLPWGTSAFLHWCTTAGLIRVAGIAYQFRHRELQDHLAR